MLHVSSVKDKISRSFSAHPVLKHLISSLLILITLTFTFYLVYHISEDGFELQELMNLRNAVVTITVLAMAIFWVSRPGIYRIITIVGIICTLLSGTLAPDFVRHRPQGSLTACKSNL